MEGTGVPLVTPFEESGEIDEPKLRDLVDWIVDRGVDFIVPAGSNSESELLTLDERVRVTEIVVDQSPVPVMAGTGHPGFVETIENTNRAAEAGADAALVVTPFYFGTDAEGHEAYYRRVADESDVPIYLYSVPAKTHVKLDPTTVGALASHENIHGMKDSSGNVTTLQRELRLTRTEAFDTFVGSGNVYAHGLDAGATGGVLALANVAPEQSVEIYERNRSGDEAGARELNSKLVELNRAITATYGVPGVKAAMRYRGAPAGTVRSPLRPLEGEALEAVHALVDAALE